MFSRSNNHCTVPSTHHRQRSCMPERNRHPRQPNRPRLLQLQAVHPVHRRWHRRQCLRSVDLDELRRHAPHRRGIIDLCHARQSRLECLHKMEGECVQRRLADEIGGRAGLGACEDRVCVAVGDAGESHAWLALGVGLGKAVVVGG